MLRLMLILKQQCIKCNSIEHIKRKYQRDKHKKSSLLLFR